jgi:hypothetical protein
MSLSRVEPGALTHYLPNRLRNPLRPINPDNACTLRLTAAAGTEFAGAYSIRPEVGSKEVYNPKAFIPHAASLRQTFVHCAIFLVAAIRRCGHRVSVTLWLTILSDQLPVIALVGRYPTNKLIGRRPLPERAVKPFTSPSGRVRE